MFQNYIDIAYFSNFGAKVQLFFDICKFFYKKKEERLTLSRPSLHALRAFFI